MTSQPATPSQGRSFNGFGKRIAVVMLGTLALAGLTASPAAALSIRGVVPGGGGLTIAPPDPCQQPQPQVISFTPQGPTTVMFGDTVTLSWNVQVASGCNYALYVNGQRQGLLQGSLPVQPVFDTSYSLTLQYGPNLGLYIPAQTGKISVACCPKDPSDRTGTRNLATISSQQMVGMFVRALGTPNTTVNVTADSLDLTGLPNWYPTVESRILISDGVHLIGGRTAVPGQPFNPGPRLFVTDHPQWLFEVSGNNVKVSGVRIEGPDMWETDTTCIGIHISDVNPNSTPPPPNGINVEIDHSEFSGWSDSAVWVQDDPGKTMVQVIIDPRTPQLVYPNNPKTEPVYIHDNFFHHNQHFHGNGYGVGLGNAHVLIERNVFDWNRHAISAAASAGTGYRAYRNLVLENGGINAGDFATYLEPIPFVQQFDMHGSDNCPGFISALYNCGTAGHDFDVRYNSFLYKHDAAVRLRGTPTLGLPVGATIMFNVFAHDFENDAVKSTVGAPNVQLNLTGRSTYYAWNTCDFDGDGINDLFIATEQTMWYCPGPSDCVTTPGSGKPTWVYLNMSTKRTDQLSLGHFSGGRVCDVVDGGFISVGGSGPWKPLSAGFKP